jgi:hypothetical protein
MSIDLVPFRETPYNLQFVFAGKMFEWSYNSSFAAGNTDWQLKTPQNETLHLTNRTMLTSSTSLEFQLWESPLVTVQGNSALSIFNVSRVSTSTSGTKIYTNPTFGGLGTNIEDIFLISGDAYTQKTPEVILKSDTDYLLRILNTGAGNQTLNFQFVWYEPSN